jgi:prepilin-type N-terminal cleavage/methylation domain-containing protein
MNMQIKKGFTLAELLVTMVISAVLILMVGAISQIAFSSHDQIRKEGDVYSDLFYGLSRMNFSVRKASALSLDNTWPNPPWVSSILIVDNSAFGLYRPAGGKIKFVFVPNKTNPGVRENIIEDLDTMSFSFTLSGTPNKSANVTVQGAKDNEPFNISNFVVTRRN